MKTVQFDHHDANFVARHREINDDLRTRCPVAYSTAHGGFWVLSRYEDVISVAKNDATYSSSISLLIPPGHLDPLIPLQSDPPEVDRYRLILMPYFMPEAVKRQEPALAADVRKCLDKMIYAGRGDMVHDLAVPVPARMTMRILGLQEDLWDKFATPIHVATFGRPGSAEYLQAEADIGRFDSLIGEAIDDRTALDTGDLISDLIRRPRNDKSLSRKEIIDLVRMIIFGGMDTVTGAVGNITAILGQDNALQTMLRSKPDLLPGAIEEFLRFEAPIQGFARKTTCPANIGGQSIAKGELVWLNWGAANHDPERFDSPGTLDVLRAKNPHVTFGIGKHLCLGARLARLELRVFLENLLFKSPPFELDEGGVQLPDTIGQLLGKKAVNIKFLV